MAGWRERGLCARCRKDTQLVHSMVQCLGMMQVVPWILCTVFTMMCLSKQWRNALWPVLMRCMCAFVWEWRAPRECVSQPHAQFLSFCNVLECPTVAACQQCVQLANSVCSQVERD